MTVVGFPIDSGVTGTGAVLDNGGAVFNVMNPAFGAVGNGIADDTDAIQDAIEVAGLVGGTVLIPTGIYKLSAPLSITQSLTIQGSGIGVSGTGGPDPTASPYLMGSILMQSAAATSGIVIAGTTTTVNLRNFAVMFAPSIMFLNTGHGVDATPSGDYGLFGSNWENVWVFGHDGNHYAYNLTKGLGMVVAGFHSWGGGGINWNGPTAFHYGNAVFINSQVSLWAGGTAHGISLNATNAQGVNLLTFIRPEVIGITIPTAFSGLGVPALTNAQYLFTAATGAALPAYISLVDPDFESPVVGCPINFGASTSGAVVVHGSPYFDANAPRTGTVWAGPQSPVFAGFNNNGYGLTITTPGTWGAGFDVSLFLGASDHYIKAVYSSADLIHAYYGHIFSNNAGNVLTVGVNGTMAITAGGVITEPGIATTAITSGALSQPAFVSGTPQQLSTTRDMTAVIAFTATLAAGTCAVALSPDGVTYTTAATLSPGILNGVDSIAIPVPVNWRLRLTFSNGTAIVTEY